MVQAPEGDADGVSQAHLALLRFTDVCVVQIQGIEGKTPRQQEDDTSLYCAVHLLAVVWDQTRRFAGARLYSSAKFWFLTCTA